MFRFETTWRVSTCGYVDCSNECQGGTRKRHIRYHKSRIVNWNTQRSKVPAVYFYINRKNVNSRPFEDVDRQGRWKLNEKSCDV
jgi:hypothetical protein